jgi:SAM-dependent methyltransferase
MIRKIFRILRQYLATVGVFSSTPCGTVNQSTRDEWLREALLRIPPGHRILDAGAGEQQYRRFCSHLNYVSQDFGQYDGKGDDTGLQPQNWNHGSLDIISDITSIPEPDESFDAVMCTEVFEHLPDPIAALREIHRLLKKNGTLILTAPFCSLTHLSPYHFYSGFNRYFYTHWMERIGFTIIEMQPNGNYFEYLGQELRRVDSIALRYANIMLQMIDHMIISILLSRLNTFSRADTKSHELLCFGYHILAKKD